MTATATIIPLERPSLEIIVTAHCVDLNLYPALLFVEIHD